MDSIGTLVKDGAAIVTLGADLVWKAAAPEWEPTAALLNATESPVANYQAGDHHLPQGVMCMNRAAGKLGAKSVLAKPIPPLPEGAIS